MSLNLNMTDISVPCASTGLSLTAMWTCIAHTGYFVLCAVLLTFLRCPGFSRAMLLLTVPLNAVAEVNQQPALDLTSLSLLLLTLSLGTNLKLLKRQIYCLHYSHALATIFFIFFFFFISAGHWVVNQVWACFQIRGKRAAPLPLTPCDIVEPQKQPVSSCHSYPPSSTPQKWVCRVHYILSMQQSRAATNDYFLLLNLSYFLINRFVYKIPQKFKMSDIISQKVPSSKCLVLSDLLSSPKFFGSIYSDINREAQNTLPALLDSDH